MDDVVIPEPVAGELLKVHQLEAREIIAMILSLRHESESPMDTAATILSVLFEAGIGFAPYADYEAQTEHRTHILSSLDPKHYWPDHQHSPTALGLRDGTIHDPNNPPGTAVTY